MNIVFVPYLKFGRKIRQYNLNKQPYYKKDFFVKKSIFCSTTSNPQLILKVKDSKSNC